MPPSTEVPPSKFSTAAFGLLAFLIFGITGLLANTIYQRNVLGWLHEGEAFSGEDVAGWWGLISGVVGSAIAVWGWRSPRKRRYHIAFLAGLALLVAANFHLDLARRAFQREELLRDARDWVVMELLLHGALFAGFVGMLGMTLILAALILDRR